ncbi:AMP-binding protein [Streptomyces sp. TS71-3]|uniref:AMP-binding protein n=1 Tax=Streptomyces sp. TS71-3 TaxID=2733862 RepID=UPI001B0D8243|nr:AMP-binding protein [Streptomyces sp. TS71-3]GHJ37165.1 putative fatty-acid-CoA ligase FadD [Streptomyces sp. TS71-3]
MDKASTSENYTVTVVERLKARGSHDAIIMGDQRISGAEAADTVLNFAAALRDAGVRDGDGVALFVRNSPEALLLQLAVHYAGCRLVFVPPEPGNGELEALVRRAHVNVFLFDPDFEERTGRIIDNVDIPHVFGIGPSSIAPDFLVAASDRAALPMREAADGRHIATLLYTGGTTGLPKLVVHRGSYYDAFLRMSAMFADDPSADPAMLIATLITHTSGHGAFLVGALTDHRIVLLRTFEAGAALAAMDDERVTRMMVVTPMMYELLDHPECRPGRFPALKTLLYAGAAASPARLRQAVERFGPVLHQLYGATENGVVTQLTPEEHDLDRPGSLSGCGRPGPGIEVELRDEEGKPVPVGQVGELYVRSGTVMQGYWNDPERTAEVLDGDGWFRSGDIARQDEEGYLYLVDRVRDIIVTGRTADNVYSRLLDDFLTAHPAIRHAATIGLPGDDDTETVHVVLVPQDPANTPDLPELTRQIVEALGDLYAPASYSIGESLPRTTVGKVDKKALRAALRAAGGSRARDQVASA